MWNKLTICLFFVFASLNLTAQDLDSIAIVDSIAVVDTIIARPENKIINTPALEPFFRKLLELQKTKKGKINIVHIGDSHIQADFISGTVRDSMQKNFGNAGRGLVFPHSLVKTNGIWDVRFSSNLKWESYRNIYPVVGNPVGLSGIALFTKSKDFALEINVKQPVSYFQTIKVITPKNRNMFDLATTSRTVVLESSQPKKISHKVRKGEALSIIADKYNVSVAAIKKANNLKSNNIRFGKSLKIPTNEMERKSVERSEFIPFEMTSDANSHFYKSETPISKIYLLPNKEESEYALNGIVLENNEAGIIYHTIGVNGAKISDYTKYPMFFEQLKALQPDLVILSLGTNESFDKLITTDYMGQMKLFLEDLKKENITAPVLVTTPPPSLFQRKYPNVFVADYTQETLAKAADMSVSVWDLFSLFGGLYGVDQNFRNGLMASDKVHYSKQGYIMQGNLLNEAIMNAYYSFKNPIQN